MSGSAAPDPGAPGAAAGDGATPDRPLRVAVDATPLLGQPTGVGAFCAGALGALAGRAALDVSAFAVSWRRRRLLDGRAPGGVRLVRRAMPARPLRWAWSRADVPPLEWFVGPAAVVHGTNFVVPPTRRAAAVVTVHDLTPVRFPQLCDPSSLAFPDLVRRALRRGAWVHTPSTSVADEVVAVLGADPERVRAVPHGVPPLPGLETGEGAGLPAQPAPRPTPMGPDGHPGGGGVALPPGVERYVLAVGTVEPRKDYPLLLAAFGEVAPSVPEVGLVVAGAPGWGADRFDEALAALPVGVRQRVVVAGYVGEADLGAAYRRAAVLAYPSVYEGFGFPPLQAMAAGVPVVATRAGAVPEVVGDAAVLVGIGDRDALADALAAALAGGPAVAERVTRGRARAASFTWEACAAGLERLYRDAAAGGR